MAKRDFYEILGVDRNADDSAIKAAYRKLAMKYHPDRNQGDSNAENRFKEATEAYEILANKQKRSAYDNFGHAAFSQGRGERSATNSAGFTFDGFADIFSDIFGDAGLAGSARRGQRRTHARGEDIRYDMEISMEEAFTGKKTKLRVQSLVRCQTCKGSGGAEGAKPTNCDTCNGRGRIQHRQGFFSIEQPCPKCAGAGRVIDSPCQQCHGEGRIEAQRELEVTIPRGVDDGTRLCLRGEGRAGRQGAPNGDLYIFLAVTEHDIFKREGTDLYCSVPVSFARAALGGMVEIPTIDRKRKRFKIPQGSQSGQAFRLHDQGMPRINSSARGNLFVALEVEVPIGLNGEQRRLLERLEESIDANPKKHLPKLHKFNGRTKQHAAKN